MAVTIYAFSIENFNRPQQELDVLFGLLRSRMIDMLGDGKLTHRWGICVRALGDRTLLPADVVATVEKLEADTKDYKK
jgi:ditrans,polycis-polyprenyl diphosphate synthase